MEIFKPYKTITDTAIELHFSESSLRKKFLFFYFRIFPFILLALLAPVLVIDDMPQNIKFFMGISVTLLVVLFLSKKYVSAVTISKQFIEVTIHGFGGKKQNTYLVNDMEKITVTVFRGKGGGFFYKLKPKTDKAVPLFTIPRIFMDIKKIPLINEKLVAITGLAIEQKS